VSRDLLSIVAAELDAPARAEALAMAKALAARFHDAQAVLFYGSVLRTGDLDGVMDFYVLTRTVRPGLRGVASRVLWPDVSYHELETEGRVLRAKVASMTLSQFQAAVGGRRIDTTIWTRFVQPAGLVWTSGPEVAEAVRRAIAAAAVTAARFAAAIGPRSGTAEDFWTALFRQTYAAEFRVERRGREQQIIGADPARYDQLLPAAWAAGGLAFTRSADGGLATELDRRERARILRAWRLRRTLGKPLNLARLAKAAFTFEGAARYAAWKIERHTGLAVPLTPWREKHVILASPGVFWRLWQARRSAPP
jgi:hypothetical protein